MLTLYYVQYLVGYFIYLYIFYVTYAYDFSLTSNCIWFSWGDKANILKEKKFLSETQTEIQREGLESSG